MAGKIQNQVATRTNTASGVQARGDVNTIMSAMLDSSKFKTRFDELLGKRAPQFISSLVTMVNADINLQQAFYEAPMTVIQSALKAASFDLPIDQNLGYAYIVPFKNSKKDADGNWKKVMEANFILGWKGMHQLALRTGVYKTINVTDIREGELKKYNRLTEEVEVVFEEDDDKREALPIIGYVGYYRLVNGAEKTIYMTVKQIENHEKKHRKGEFMGKGWKENFDAKGERADVVRFTDEKETLYRNACLANRDVFRLVDGAEELSALTGGAPDDKPRELELIDIMKKTLTEEEERITVLHVLWGYKHREIGRILSLPAATVRSKYSRAMEKMRCALTER
jgi:recombination protein RecT